MITTKIGLSLLSIVVALSLMAGATFAYFTDSDTSENNQIKTGTLAVDVTNQVSFEPTDPIDNWQPGEERFVRFDVKNTGSLPIYIRGLATGDWTKDSLDPDTVKVALVEFWNGSGWQDIVTDASGVIYYSPDGTDTNLTPVAKDETVEFRLTLVLDGDTAGSEYESETFNGRVTVEARQTTTGATWPTTTP